MIAAVGVTCEEKGRRDDGTFHGQETFNKYLFGVVKGLVHYFRKDSLDAFILEIEGASKGWFRNA